MIGAILKRYWRPLAEILLVAASLCLFGYCWYASGYSSANEVWQKKWTARDLSDAKSLEQQQTVARTEEQRRQQAVNEANDNAQKQLAAARDDARTANDSVNRLQRTLNELQRKERGNSTCNTSATGSGPTGRTAGDLQAELLRESLDRSRQLAAEADQRRIAGLTCERSYDALSRLK